MYERNIVILRIQNRYFWSLILNFSKNAFETAETDLRQIVFSISMETWMLNVQYQLVQMFDGRKYLKKILTQHSL